MKLCGVTPWMAKLQPLITNWNQFCYCSKLFKLIDVKHVKLYIYDIMISMAASKTRITMFSIWKSEK